MDQLHVSTISLVHATVTRKFPVQKQTEKEMLLLVEEAARTCWKSEVNMKEEPFEPFLRGIIDKGHESVIEHSLVSFKIKTDRGVTHETVRHRIASHSQESTRYVNYQKRGIEFLNPAPAFPILADRPDIFHAWMDAITDAARYYNKLVSMGAPLNLARGVLPNALKADIIVSMNFRSWRNFCELRCSPKAHPQMREVALQILKSLYSSFPVIFEDHFKIHEKEINERFP